MNYTLFVSDLHLQEPETEKTALFLDFLKTIAIKAQALYILGDLFEAWIGDDVDTEFNREVQSALKQFTALRVPIYLMCGNRDFLLGKIFAKNTGINIMQDPCKIYLYGRATLLTHGDLLCINDRSLMWFRKYAHNQKLQKYFLLLPISVRKFLAQKLRAKSKRDALVKTDETKGIVNSAVLDLMQKYEAVQMIHGHVHVPAIYEVSTENLVGRRVTLGSWDNVPNYMIYYEDHTINMVY